MLAVVASSLGFGRRVVMAEAAPPDLTEVPAAGCLHVVFRGEKVLLYNSGTGEVKDLACEPEETAAVTVQDNGVGLVTYSSEHRGDELHTDILSKALCKEGGVDGNEIVHDGDSWERTSLSALLEQYSHNAVALYDDGIKIGTTQVWRFKAGLPPTRSRVWWSLPHLAAFVVSECIASHFLKKTKDKTTRVLQWFSWHPENVRESRRSILTTASQSEGVVVQKAGPALQFHAATTRATMGILLSWALQPPRADAKFTLAPRMAEKWLCRIISAASAVGGFPVRGVAGELLFNVSCDGRISVEDLLLHEFMPLRVLAENRLGNYVDAENTIGLYDFMAVLHTVAHAPSKYPTPGPHARGWLQAVLEEIHLQVECSMEEDWWAEGRNLDIRPTTAPSGKQTTVSKAFKFAVLETAREMPVSTTPGQMLASGDVMSDGVAPNAVQGHGSLAKQTITDEVLAYLSAARASCANQRVIHMTFDGVAAGEENLFFIFWLKGKKGAIAPQKVPRVQETPNP